MIFISLCFFCSFTEKSVEMLGHKLGILLNFAVQKQEICTGAIPAVN